MRYLAFDFDGVLVDSTTECLSVGEIAWARMRSSQPLAVPAVADPWMRRMRPLVRGGGEYVVLFVARREGIEIQSPCDYLELCDQLKTDIEEYQHLFYDARREMKVDDRSVWLSLHEPIRPAIEAFQRAFNAQRSVLVTLKDRESVIDLLAWQEVVVPPGSVIDRTQVESKADALRKWQWELGVHQEDVGLLDDNPAHLAGVIDEGFHGQLAQWAPLPFPEMTDPRISSISISQLVQWACMS